MANITLFSQIIARLDRSMFSKLVKNGHTDKHHKGYNSWSHLVSMIFCQFAKSQSVRDIGNGLRSATGNFNRLGIKQAPSKSTISLSKQASFLGIIQGLLLCLITKFRTALICNQPYKQFIKTNLYSYHEKP